MERRNVLTLEPQDPEFVAAVFSHDSNLRRAIEGRRLDIVVDGRPLATYDGRLSAVPRFRERLAALKTAREVFEV